MHSYLSRKTNQLELPATNVLAVFKVGAYLVMT